MLENYTFTTVSVEFSFTPIAYQRLKTLMMAIAVDYYSLRGWIDTDEFCKAAIASTRKYNKGEFARIVDMKNSSDSVQFEGDEDGVAYAPEYKRVGRTRRAAIFLIPWVGDRFFVIESTKNGRIKVTLNCEKRHSQYIGGRFLQAAMSLTCSTNVQFSGYGMEKSIAVVEEEEEEELLGASSLAALGKRLGEERVAEEEGDPKASVWEEFASNDAPMTTLEKLGNFRFPEEE